MTFLKLGIGALFFILGWVYLYKPNLVLQLNRIARDFLFNDRLILLERKKLSILFFCLSFIALYMGLTSLSKLSGGEPVNISDYKMYLAMQDHRAGNYNNALQRYQHILSTDPSNTRVLKRIAYTYAAMGEKKKAVVFLKKALQTSPKSKEIIAELEKLGVAEAGKK